MKKLIPKCQKAWTALTYKLNKPPHINQDGSSEKQNKVYTLPNYTNTGREVSIYGNPIKEEPVDATRTTPQYNKTLTEYDSAKLTDAYDEVLRQQVHSIYGGLRFTPYVKYATDFADAFGLYTQANDEIRKRGIMVTGRNGEYVKNCNDISNCSTNTESPTVTSLMWSVFLGYAVGYLAIFSKIFGILKVII